MGHWEIAFTGTWPALLVLSGGAAAAALAWAFYRRKRPVLPTRTFAMLAALRLLAIGVVTVFLLQPVLRVARTEARQAVVAVVVDASESMGIRDTADERSRLDAAVGLLTGPPQNVLKGLARGLRNWRRTRRRRPSARRSATRPLRYRARIWPASCC